MRLVLVDPSRAVQRAMTHLIESAAHQVKTFSDGLEALSYIGRETDVRALITSTQPLGISGIELCAAARNLGGIRRALHIILMSSTEDYHLAVAALDNGADDFIHKPPNPDELAARLRLADRVTAMKQQLIQYATTDTLTGLFNRRAFFERADEMCRSAAAGKPLSAIVFDIDHFKKINDTCGHDVGDQVLAAIGAQAKALDGVIGRLGGEEFCMLVQADASDALEIAAALQRSIRALGFNHSGTALKVTCSFGITEWENGDAIDRLLRRADIAMYEAKRSGRDRIVAADTFALDRSHESWRGAARASPR